MRSARAALVVLGLLAACESAPTELLSPAAEAGLGAIDAAPDAPDATQSRDATPDSGRETCTTAAECSGPLPACEDPRRCTCGCYRVCSGGQCTGFCSEDPSCFADAGARPECATASDCAPAATPRACGGEANASCAFGHCVADCQGPRTCAWSGDCVTCGKSGEPPTTHCRACIAAPFPTALVEESTCALAPGQELEGTIGQECMWTFSDNAGRARLRLIPLEGGALIGTLDDGTDPCLVSFAPTGALRTTWACAGCTMTLFHR